MNLEKVWIGGCHNLPRGSFRHEKWVKADSSKQPKTEGKEKGRQKTEKQRERRIQKKVLKITGQKATNE